MKKINPSISSFESFIGNDFVYVDKTDIIYHLITRGNSYIFCSRPLRFGKSLTISTLEAIFKGKKELFKGLKIYDSNYDWKEYPVLHLDFALINASSPTALETKLNEKWLAIAKQYGVPFEQTPFCNLNLERLLYELDKKGKVVVLIDNYDKILSSNIGNPEAEDMRRIIASLFVTLKASCEYLKFVFATGVTGFTNITSFSTANNFYDITTDVRYSSLFGYTEDEVQYYFSEHIEMGMQKTGMTQEEYMSKLSLTYGGYRFSPRQKKPLFNPSSLGFFFADGGIDVLQRLKPVGFWPYKR